MNTRHSVSNLLSGISCGLGFGSFIAGFSQLWTLNDLAGQTARAVDNPTWVALKAAVTALAFMQAGVCVLVLIAAQTIRLKGHDAN